MAFYSLSQAYACDLFLEEETVESMKKSPLSKKKEYSPEFFQPATLAFILEEKKKDEKLLFDLVVSLQYSNSQEIASLCQLDLKIPHTVYQLSKKFVPCNLWSPNFDFTTSFYRTSLLNVAVQQFDYLLKEAEYHFPYLKLVTVNTAETLERMNVYQSLYVKGFSSYSEDRAVEDFSSLVKSAEKEEETCPCPKAFLSSDLFISSWQNPAIFMHPLLKKTRHIASLSNYLERRRLLLQELKESFPWLWK